MEVKSGDVVYDGWSFVVVVQAVRALLFAIAYRILGSVSEAEDAVRETWLRYEASPTPHTSIKVFLSAVVTRISRRAALGPLPVGEHF